MDLTKILLGIKNLQREFEVLFPKPPVHTEDNSFSYVLSSEYCDRLRERVPSYNF